MLGEVGEDGSKKVITDLFVAKTQWNKWDTVFGLAQADERMNKWLKGESTSSDLGLWGFVKEREKYSFNDLDKYVHKKKPAAKKTSGSGR